MPDLNRFISRAIHHSLWRVQFGYWYPIHVSVFFRYVYFNGRFVGYGIHFNSKDLLIYLTIFILLKIDSTVGIFKYSTQYIARRPYNKQHIEERKCVDLIRQIYLIFHVFLPVLYISKTLYSTIFDFHRTTTLGSNRVKSHDIRTACYEVFQGMFYYNVRDDQNSRGMVLGIL